MEHRDRVRGHIPRDSVSREANANDSRKSSGAIGLVECSGSFAAVLVDGDSVRDIWCLLFRSTIEARVAHTNADEPSVVFCRDRHDDRRRILLAEGWRITLEDWQRNRQRHGLGAVPFFFWRDNLCSTGAHRRAGRVVLCLDGRCACPLSYKPKTSNSHADTQTLSEEIE